MYHKPANMGPIGPDELRFDVLANLRRLAQRSCLPASDIEGVLEHLDYCESTGSGVAALTGEILRHKLSHSRRLAPEMPLLGIASGNSLLRYCIRGQEPRVARLTHRSRLWADAETVPVRSLLGATLLGMRVGHSGPLLLSDGSFTEVALLELLTIPPRRNRPHRGEPLHEALPNAIPPRRRGLPA